MFSPHDSPAVNDWFRRFDAASQHLPAEERAAQREEIQQHLEGLAAAKMAQGQPSEAAWKAALMQFGDPAQIGRKMYQEWRLGTTGFRADMRAILFGIGLQVLRRFAVQLLYFFWFNSLYAHGQNLTGFAFVVNLGFTYGATTLIYAAIGRKYPLQALKSAFYTDVLWNLWSWLLFAIAASNPHHALMHPSPVWFIHSMLLIPPLLWPVIHVVIAYLASVTRRGWYRPSLADFKLTLPPKQRKLIR